MRIVVCPATDPQREIDVTNRLVSIIAEELWRQYGGNEQLNWLEAERHLERIVGTAREEASETEMASAAAAHDEEDCRSCIEVGDSVGATRRDAGPPSTFVGESRRSGSNRPVRGRTQRVHVQPVSATSAVIAVGETG